MDTAHRAHILLPSYRRGRPGSGRRQPALPGAGAASGKRPASLHGDSSAPRRTAGAQRAGSVRALLSAVQPSPRAPHHRLVWPSRPATVLFVPFSLLLFFLSLPYFLTLFGVVRVQPPTISHHLPRSPPAPSPPALFLSSQARGRTPGTRQPASTAATDGVRIDRLNVKSPSEGAARTSGSGSGTAGARRGGQLRRSGSLQGFSMIDRDESSEALEEATRRASFKAEEEEARAAEEAKAIEQAALRQKAKAQRRVNSVRRRSTSLEALAALEADRTKERTPGDDGASPSALAPAGTSAASPPLSDTAVTLRPRSTLSTGDVEEFTFTLRKADGGFGLSVKECEPGGASTVAVNNLKPGLAAQMAGVLKDDFILSVDGNDTTTASKSDVMSILRATGTETVGSPSYVSLCTPTLCPLTTRIVC